MWRNKKLAAFIAYLFSAFSITILYSHLTLPGNLSIEMIQGTARRPFVYRMLITSIIHGIVKVTPESLRQTTEKIFSAETGQKLIVFLQLNRLYLYEYLLILAAKIICFFLFAVVLEQLVLHFYNVKNPTPQILAVCGLFGMPLFGGFDGSMIYDPVTVLLFSTALLMVAKDRLLAFYAVFILATFNKETSILLIGLFWIGYFKQMKRIVLINHIALLLVVWAIIKIVITLAFWGNRGGFVEYHIIGNNLHPVVLAYMLSYAAIFAPLLYYQWSQKPTLLRYGMFVILVPLFVICLFVGMLDEMRLFLEVYPFLFLLSVPALLKLAEISNESWNRNRSPVTTGEQ
jgi:hypothetical protein